jgi:hypothetical protein
MDPETIEPGTEVGIRPVANPVGDSSHAYVVSLHDDVYVLYIEDDGLFAEMSRDTVDVYPRSTVIHRWEWMSIYVAALDTGSETTQKGVEALLRKSESHGKIFGDGEIRKITTDDGRTLLHIAVTHNRYTAARTLLEPKDGFKINVNAVERDKHTAIWDKRTALWYAGDMRMYKLVLEHDADPNCGRSATYGSREGNAPKILLLYGKDEEHITIRDAPELPQTARVLSRVMCSAAPISRLPTDILRTYVLPLVVG